MNRRHFLKSSALAGAGALALTRRAWPFAQSPAIRKFITSLPGLGVAGKNELGQYIPVATPRTVNFAGLSTDVYSLAVAAFSERMHPDLNGLTELFGYTDTANYDQRYLGGAIVARKGRPVLLNVANQLPGKHILPSIQLLWPGRMGR
jgi:hypothetical protein